MQGYAIMGGPYSPKVSVLVIVWRDPPSHVIQCLNDAILCKKASGIMITSDGWGHYINQPRRFRYPTKWAV